MQQEVARLREDIEALVTQAYQQDAAEDAALGSRRGDELPAELARREDRLARIETAMRRLEAQAKAEAEAERQHRAAVEAERQRTGKKRRGKAPQPVEARETLGFDPYIATARQRHHGPEADAPETPLTVQERMAAKVRTPAGKALYARRKVIVEPVFGQIKEARGFRRFLLRGLANIRGEWRLVCLTHNLLKVWRYGRVLSAA